MDASVLCTHCQGPIPSRAELVVAGHGLRPFHAACYPMHSATQPWYRKPSWPVNRWRSLIPFNLLILGIIAVVHFAITPVPEGRVSGLVLIVAIANVWLLLAKLVSYVSIERHLP